MLLLSNASSLFRLVTSGTQLVHVHVSWVDADGDTITPDGKNSQIATATTTDIVLSPPPSTVRNVKFVSICNTDPTTTTTVTVQHFDGAITATVHFSVDLLVGYTLFYEDKRGWYMLFLGAEVFATLP